MSRFFKNALIFVMAFVWFLNLSSCLPEAALQNIVVTEDILYLSGERVKLTGRVIETNGNVDDHGFQISEASDFSSPIIITLGPKENGLGRFIGEYELLNISTAYYYRSFANISGNEVVGQTKQFSSLKPRIDSFFPDNGLAGSTIAIHGANFTTDSRVFLDGNEMVIVSIEEETLIEARVPAIGNTVEVEISVMVQDTTMVFDQPYAYHFGFWEIETTFFDNMQLYNTMWLKEGSEFIFGLGAENDFERNLKIWKLDLSTYSWTDLNFPGSSFTRSPFNSGGYWGAGIESQEFTATILSPFFWRYSAGAFELKQFLPFTTNNSVGLTLNGNLYVFGGIDNTFTAINSVYQYQELTDSWQLVGEMPIVAENPIEISNVFPYFVHNDLAYFLLPSGVIWRFDPISNQWQSVASFPSNLREFGAAVVLNNKAYIGLFSGGSEIWEWDILNDIWTAKLAFPGPSRDINIGFFAHENKAYFFRSKANGGQFESDPRMELWSFDPTRIN